MARWEIALYSGVTVLGFNTIAGLVLPRTIAAVVLAIGLGLVGFGLWYRPREQTTSWASGVIGTAGEGWGEGIGPVPGTTGELTAAADLPATLERGYRAPRRALVEELRAADARLLAARGYQPVAEAWPQGTWRRRDWVAAVLFAVITWFIGILVVLYMLTNKPMGTLTVTYERAAA